LIDGSDRPRVLMVSPGVNPPGGGNGVAAWMLQALKDDYRIRLVALEAPDLTAINRFYGTSLRSSDLQLILPRGIAGAIARRPSAKLNLVRHHYLLRVARRLASRQDVAITANNESDLGTCGIQYIHFPKFDPIRPHFELRWYNRPAIVARAYPRLANLLTGFSIERMRRNLTIVNSDFTGARVRALHGVTTTTLYPPVVASFPVVPWEHREDGFVCIGRISREKRIELIIDILSRVRRTGLSPHLHIIGTSDDKSYAASIGEAVSENRSWISIHENLSREEVGRLVSAHRYGIHAMEDEPFGMAVAEMVAAKSIVFAHRSGGPIEILGGNERLLYGSPEDCAEKIVLAISNRDYRDDLRRFLASRSGLFSTQRFIGELRALVCEFADSRNRLPSI
jgi:glycosyltransferase involved in cell wall biosynthesis